MQHIYYTYTYYKLNNKHCLNANTEKKIKYI